MTSYLKPLNAGKPKAPTSVEYRSEGNEAEKPFLAEGLAYNPRLEQEDKRLKQSIRYLKFVSRVLNLMMSCVVVGMMINTVVTYFNSKNITADGMSPWPADPKIWPTLMMLGVSGLGLLSNAAVLIAYACGQKAANRTDSVASFISGLYLAVHLIAWAVAAGLFKQQNALHGVTNDLWSWSCSPSADARAETFKKEVNYDFLCMSNNTSWYLSLASVGTGIITLTLYILAIQRINSKKKLKRAQAACGVHVPAEVPAFYG